MRCTERESRLAARRRGFGHWQQLARQACCSVLRVSIPSGNHACPLAPESWEGKVEPCSITLTSCQGVVHRPPGASLQVRPMCLHLLRMWCRCRRRRLHHRDDPDAQRSSNRRSPDAMRPCASLPCPKCLCAPALMHAPGLVCARRAECPLQALTPHEHLTDCRIVPRRVEPLRIYPNGSWRLAFVPCF